MAKNNDTGKWGEDIAADILASEGYAICERNWRAGHDEIDIVAVRGKSLVFAEVKTRTDPGVDPLEAVDDKKIRRLAHAALAYIRSKNLPHYPQFDLFAISGTPGDYKVEHIPDAFDIPVKTYR